MRKYSFETKIHILKFLAFLNKNILLQRSWTVSTCMDFPPCLLAKTASQHFDSNSWTLSFSSIFTKFTINSFFYILNLKKHFIASKRWTGLSVSFEKKKKKGQPKKSQVFSIPMIMNCYDRAAAGCTPNFRAPS